MNHRTVFAVAAFSAATILGQVPAHADPMSDRQLAQNCIDSREWRVMGYGQTMHEVEALTGAEGHVMWSASHGQQAIAQYRWCGHPSSDGYFQVYYAQNRRGEYRSQADIWVDFTCTNPNLVVCGHQPDNKRR